MFAVRMPRATRPDASSVSTSPVPQNEQLLAALRAGRKIEAIKIHRDATGAGLAEAKEYVEKLEAGERAAHPELFQKPAGKSGCTSVLAALALVFGLVCWLAKR